MMIDIEEPPTLVERYQCEVEHGRSGRLVHAAGLASEDGSEDGLGVVLMRLRGEYDSARAAMPPTDALTDHAMVLISLRNLKGAKDRLGRLAMALNTESWALDQTDALKVVGRVLDHWLDSNCRTCSGRGTVGGSHRGELTHRCGTCSGSKQRRKVSATAVEARFAALLADCMGELMARAEGTMRLKLRHDDSSA